MPPRDRLLDPELLDELLELLRELVLLLTLLVFELRVTLLLLDEELSIALRTVRPKIDELLFDLTFLFPNFRSTEFLF